MNNKAPVSPSSIDIPCRIGDQVWAIRNYKGVCHPQQGIVSELFFTPDMQLVIVVKHIARGEWGQAVFATKGEAEAAILAKNMQQKDGFQL